MMTFKKAQDTLLTFLKNSKVQKKKEVWEKMDDKQGWKWVLVVHNLNWGDSLITYTKFIFKTTKNKKSLLSNKISYLYDLNCNYKELSFDNSKELSLILNNIIKNNTFGPSLSSISKFMRNPTKLINKQLYDSKVKDITVYDTQYRPRYSITPCERSSFDIYFDINNDYEVHLNIKKEGNKNFLFTFNVNNEHTINVEKHSLDDMVFVILSFMQKYINYINKN